MSTHSHRIVRLVRLDDTELDAADWVGRSDGPGLAIHDVDCATRRDLAESGFDQAEPRREITFWWELFAFFMEGFALYGAALHPTTAVPVRTMLVTNRNGRPHEDDDEPPEPVMAGAGVVGNGKVVTLDRAWPRVTQPADRWTWLHSLGETLTTLWWYLRREREIKQAVSALMQLDDRTLRDLGIHGQSDIERMVRYCRDC